MTKEILDLTEKIQQRVFENIDIIFKQAEEKGNKFSYQDALTTCLIMEIATLAYAIKKMK